MKLSYDQIDHTAAFFCCHIETDEPMKRHTTFQIGGPADRFYTVETSQQLAALLKALVQAEIPYLVLGKGSNLLVSDQGFRGAVLYLSGKFREVKSLGDGAIRAGAAASLASVCAFARDNGLSGLEFAWGIPGSVGGAVYMNAGAYGGEMKDVVKRVESLTPEGKTESFFGEALDFSYRRSRYTGKEEAVTFAEFQLEPSSGAQIAGKMEELMGRRKAKQPYDMPSAGSIFKRPEGAFAAALIEECGLKGLQVGGAQVSPKHAGFIVNTGGATCANVLALIEKVQETVLREKGISLECEVRVIG